MNVIEIGIVGGLWSIVLGLVFVIWNQLTGRIQNMERNTESRLTDHDKHIGLHYSKISDLRSDVTGAQTNIENHSDKFNELVSTLHRIEDKIDTFRERRT